MTASRTRILVLQWALLGPLTLFLAAIAARRLPLLLGLCGRIIGWYVTRFWTLPVLLLVLPGIALVTGLVTLSFESNRTSVRKSGDGLWTAAPPGSENRPAIVATTALGAALLAVVILHMLEY